MDTASEADYCVETREVHLGAYSGKVFCDTFSVKGALMKDYAENALWQIKVVS